ncbi:hypothetical protein XCR_3623 [Xanthomonas campestris pv. raphani 756C]|nr:hypothetical protein XCR_3623 [Xanthomonas campestris pv. raphani 756C]
MRSTDSSDCAFCAIVAGTAPASVGNWLAFYRGTRDYLDASLSSSWGSAC